jgi:hypothetical protein
MWSSCLLDTVVCTYTNNDYCVYCIVTIAVLYVFLKMPCAVTVCVLLHIGYGR